MRELDTESPVVWPAWCYHTGEASGEGGSAGSAGSLDLVAASSGRAGLSHHHLLHQQQHQNHHQASSASAASSPNRRASPATPAAGSHLSAAATPRPPRARRRPATTHNGLDAPQVKTERLTPDNNSTSSRSVTPSAVASGHPGTPPNAGGESGAAATTPGSQAHHLKHMEQMMGRNYSDFMRSLAAKYNNSNPNEYLSGTRNGFHSPVLGASAFKNSTSSSASAATAAAAAAAFAAGLQLPAGAAPITLAAGTDRKAHPELAIGGGAGLFGTAVGATAVQVASAASSASLFPPMLDMSSTQALLHMVRTANAAQGAAELESYLKGANKREPALTTPLDLSSPSGLGPQRKRARTSEPLQPMINSITNSISLSQPRRPGSVSPGKSLSSSPTAQMTTSTTTTTSGPGSSPGGSSSASPPPVRCPSLCAHPPCGPDAKPITGWSVDDVVGYVSSIDICAEYAQKFREHRIDGSSLPLLSEEHLTGPIGMKLGPALKLRLNLARKLGACSVCLHCAHCHQTPQQHQQQQQQQQQQPQQHEQQQQQSTRRPSN